MRSILACWGRGAPTAQAAVCGKQVPRGEGTPPPGGRLRHSLSTLTFTLTLTLTSYAFPPAPYYTIYGVVRDQVGATLNVEGAVIKLLRDNVEIGRAAIQTGVLLDQNYELNIRIDQTRSGTRTYTTSAVAPQGVFSLQVSMNGQNFYPIEANGTLRVGNGGERVRLDLSLGADANNDGLPDAWQEWVLYQAGRRPGEAGWDINLVTKNGDFDGDGTGNFLEYLAGTFAGDATERFELRLTGKTATAVSFEFYAITGKVYGIEESTDLQTWTTAPFSLTAGGATTTLHKAAAVGVLPVFTAATTGASRFFRLTVR
jgi:hypothetical protein